MNLDPELLRVLACPLTGQKLSRAPQHLVESMNRDIENKTLQNAGGVLVEHPFEGLLLTADRTIAYPVIMGIPHLMDDESVCVPAHYFEK